MSALKPLIAGNWKMVGLPADLKSFADAMRAWSGGSRGGLLICPPATLLAAAVQAFDGLPIAVGGQDCHAKASGAHTGDIAAPMIAAAGGTFVIVGHSERRADHGETDAQVKAKAEAALAAGLTPIICIGESLAQRQAGETLAVVETSLRGSLPSGDLARVVVAYEPVWAIGTGLTANADQIAEVHAHLRKVLLSIDGTGAAVKLLYGGSVKPGNAAEILATPDVNGVLVGGASLVAADFQAIASACPV